MQDVPLDIVLAGTGKKFRLNPPCKQHLSSVSGRSPAEQNCTPNFSSPAATLSVRGIATTPAQYSLVKLEGLQCIG